MPRESPHARLAATLALEGTALAPRCGTADTQITAAHSPLKSTPLDNIGGSSTLDGNDPQDQAVLELTRAREARKQYNHAMRQWAEAMSTLHRLCDEWASIHATPTGRKKLGPSIWCDNPNHTGNEPRHNGRWCSYCEYIKQDYGRLPNAALLDRRSRSTKLSQPQIKALLKISDGSAA
jgi:hypothetical protein